MAFSNFMRIAVLKYLREKISLEEFNAFEINHHERDDLIALII
mgnify:CR=1 FL=1|jgi:hypothetical protein